MVVAGVVVRAFLSGDVAPCCSGVDFTGIEGRSLTVRGNGVQHEAIVLPFYGLARMNGHSCPLFARN